ncbi:biotin/acetyl-CoA-carboxylase ligase [Allomuricauda ruestringensis DSM 13258]|uniref:Biotin/acetyl-CoA-carboxylase ligase n=1 Tax=Allomuricauda ruestringensis (strain DSM 13258 / CIP 107369 / LMG 19739 / B1) TaxID=886377 RepID=G2PLR9_ALLRU|nr:biotin--[acetyl-CoA-carboxylase] ligase [Allomuricauda ruestringensis]AEM71156.1 biotin/acetyl-CoA-carboxylase ligase [Allomuricauda ruestringensis DSM 13258]
MGQHFQILKLDATDSTNLYLKDLLRSENPSDYTVVVTDKQLKGRGQMGAVWQSCGGKNLTFSVLKKFDSLSVQHQFVLNIAISLAVFDAVTELSVPNVKVKWPNDIMSGSMKICGILIENILKGAKVGHSIIGIGLNVNQTDFEGLDKASSLKSTTGRNFDLEELLHIILERIGFHLEKIETKTVSQLLPAYEKVLFRKDKPSTFANAQGKMFIGYIRRVSPSGKLVLELEDRVFKAFDLKEVSLLY